MSRRSTTTGSPRPGGAASRAASLSIWALLSASTGLLACGAPEDDRPTSPAAEAPNVPRVSNRRALLFGINEYQAKEVSTLHGCLHDVAAIRLLLERRYGFPPEQITTLTNAKATRAGMLEALRTLTQQTAKGDQVVVHFSGHGSQAPDTDGDEADGIDETLVPHDGRTADVADITDDELHELLEPIVAKAEVVRVVLDSCHSGTGTRSDKLLARRVPPDTRVELYRTTRPGSRGVREDAGLKHVLMTGASASQTAIDGPIAQEANRFFGAFTYSLVRSIERSPAERSMRAMFDDIGEEFRRLGTTWSLKQMPEPQLEGPPKDLEAPFLPASPNTTSARRVWVDVARVDGSLALTDHNAVGVVEGALWALYGPVETRFQSEDCAALAVVRRKSDGVRLEIKSERRPPPAPGRAVLVLLRPDAGPVPIRLEAEEPDRARADALFGTLQKSLPQVTRVGDPKGFAQLYLQVDGDRCEVRGADNLSQVALLSFASDDVAGRIVQVLQKLGGADQILTVDAGDAPIQLEVETPRTPPPQKRSWAISADQAAPVYRLRGQPTDPRTAENSLQLVIRADRRCYLTIVGIGPDGTAAQMFPNAESEKRGFHPDGLIPGGEAVRIPDSLEPGNRAGFFWDCQPPLGRETIRVFATLDSAAAKELRSAIARSRDVASAVSPRGGVEPTAGPSALLNPAVRSFETVADRPPAPVQWRARTLVVHTER